MTELQQCLDLDMLERFIELVGATFGVRGGPYVLFNTSAGRIFAWQWSFSKDKFCFIKRIK